MIVVVDYGMGNLGSIVNMLRRVGQTATVTSDPNEIQKADKLILPGVGAFDRGMESLNQLALLEVLNEKVVDRKTPILGICLGMHLMTQGSEEGQHKGLGWIEAKTVRFDFNGNSAKMKTPHMGWNLATFDQGTHLFRDLPTESKFYFVHSYHLVCSSSTDATATTNYGYTFVSAFQHDNIMGVQFHPEKSHKFGMKLLKNFVEL